MRAGSKPMCDFSVLAVGCGKGCGWQVSWGSSLPTGDLGRSQCISSLGGTAGKGSGPSGGPSLTHLHPEPSLLGLLVGGLHRRPLQAPLLRPPYGEDSEPLKALPSPNSQHLSLLASPSQPCPPPLDSGPINLPEPPDRAPSAASQPHTCADPPDPGRVTAGGHRAAWEAVLPPVQILAGFYPHRP